MRGRGGADGECGGVVLGRGVVAYFCAGGVLVSVSMDGCRGVTGTNAFGGRGLRGRHAGLELSLGGECFGIAVCEHIEMGVHWA